MSLVELAEQLSSDDDDDSDANVDDLDDDGDADHDSSDGSQDITEQLSQLKTEEQELEELHPDRLKIHE